MALITEAFDNLSLFYENDTTVIFKGVNKDDGRNVFLKSYKNSNESARIKREFDLIAGKNISGATNMIAISYNDDKNYLVFEDNGAVVLDDYLKDHEIDVKTFLEIAKNAAESLISIHRNDIVHCDVKPANMLIHPETLEICFIDFGISFLQTNRSTGIEGFAGTLEFMAPEQTGRLNMVVDNRSDLYSLGIVLYYILTKALPFTGETPMEIIHAQTVLPPRPISEFVSVDHMVEALVLKLMEKAPKRRYQSAESLAFDLLRCQRGLGDDGKIEPFMLGERDVFASIEPGRKLYGKEQLLTEMKSVFHSTPKDRSALVLVHGSTGVGKKALLDAFDKYVDQHSGYLLRGSFDWKQNPEPYSAIRELFEGFDLFAYNSNLPLPEYCTKILEALGENAQVLLDIIPSFEHMLGEQPPVRKLNPKETQERARQVFRKTLEILCDAPSPYVLVFDNVQWADDNSIDLLLTAIEGEAVGNCILVLSYQDTDPAFLQNMTERVSRLRLETLGVTDLQVTHLNRDDVAIMVEDFFDQDTIQSRELVDIIYNATGGVLTQIRSYLQMMYRAGQIQYHGDTDAWTIHLENMDENILQSMESRYKAELEALPAHKRDHLAKLSSIGEHFALDEAAHIFDLEEAALLKTANAMLDKGWFLEHGQAGRYSFASQTVFDLCYDQLTRQEKDENHRQIVSRLYEKHHEDEGAMLQHSTILTHQVLRSDRALFSDAVMHDISKYKLTAAVEFMKAANMSQAANTFQNGLKLLGSTPFETDYSLAFQLHLNYAMCCFALHDYEKATELFELAVSHADNEDDTYEAYYQIVTQYLSNADWDQAKVYAKRYLKRTGLLLDDDVDVMAAGDREYERFLALTGNDGITLCLRLEPTEDPVVEHHGNMLAMLADALYFNIDPKCKYYLYKAINFAAEHKAIYTEFTRTFCVGAARYASVKQFEKAKAIIEVGIEYAELKKQGQAFLWCIYGNMISHWVNPMSETMEIYKKAKYHALMEGNAFYEAFADMMLLNYHSFIGENLEDYHREALATLHNLDRARLDALKANFTTFRQYARCLLGRTSSPDSFDDAQFSEASLEEIRGTWQGIFNDTFFFIYRLRSLYIHLYFEEAVEYAEKYKALSQQHNMSAFITHVQFYYYYSMSLIELCRKYPERREEYAAIIKENQVQQKIYAERNPENFEYKYRLVEAGLQGVYAESIELIEEYSICHRGFEAKGLIWDAIFVERLVGNFWLKRNIPQYVEIHRRRRLDYYKGIGARYCIYLMRDVDENRHLRRRAGLASTVHTMHTMHTMHNTHLSSTMGTMGTMGTGTSSHYTGINTALDFQALLEVLGKLITKDTMASLTSEFLTLLLQNGNAEKAFLVLDSGERTQLVAARHAIEEKSDFNESELPIDLSIIDDHLVPKKLMDQAKAKSVSIVANTARNEFLMLEDAYLMETKPESFLCMPIFLEEKHLGVVYLENASLAGSFPEGRVHFLEAMVMQVSALIQNLKNVDQLADYTKDLERRLSSYLSQQNALIAGIAHEINSPVGVCLTVATKVYEKTVQVIDALGNKALGKGALDKYLQESKEGLNIINNNIMRAGDLVQNFKKMSVEQSTEVFENLDFGNTLRSIVEYTRPGVKKKIDTIEIEVPEELWVYSSNGVLAQVFTNLIMNSAIHGFEHMEKENCKVSIKVVDMPTRDEIEITYTDNGKGMTEEEKEKVFQPFYTTKRNRGGSGLGGHIILTNVTQNLGGSVQCDSEPGKGTTFTITLPKHKSDPKEG